mmetsp:Transcript_16288/g.35204  ORF Transcript_16288/g.35204 Transcript_16288/m.35204 type:complete len:100 (+) Transcript_16288:389-688(+)
MPRATLALSAKRPEALHCTENMQKEAPHQPLSKTPGFRGLVVGGLLGGSVIGELQKLQNLAALHSLIVIISCLQNLLPGSNPPASLVKTKISTMQHTLQ